MTKEVKPKKKKNYINNADLLKELEISNQKGKMTDGLTKMLMTLTHRYAMKGRFANYTYNEDMQAFALLTIVKVWRGFNAEKSDNPFAYFTQTIKHAFFQFDNGERKQRDIRDELLTSHGEAPSFSYLDRYGHDDFEDHMTSNDSVKEVNYGTYDTPDTPTDTPSTDE